MQKPAMLALATLLVAAGSAHGQQSQAGRYQMVAVPASQSQTFPEALMLDTATGQSWILITRRGGRLNGFRSPFPRAKIGRPHSCRPRLTRRLYHETGRAIEWVPLPFSAGKDRPSPFLPPPPDQVDGSR